MTQRTNTLQTGRPQPKRNWFHRIWDRSRIRQNMLMFLLMLLFGFILMNHVMSVRAATVSSSLLTRYKQRQEDLARYETKYNALLAENNLLNDRKTKAIADLLTEKGDINLLAELQTIRILAGFTTVQGKGITLTLDDKPGFDTFLDSDQSIVHDGDIRHAINILNAAGAAAFSINNLRFTNASNILCIGSTIRCNQDRLIPPYVIKALGDPNRLAEAIANDQEFNIRQSAGIELIVKVQKESELVIPAFAEADNIEQFIDLLEVVKK